MVEGESELTQLKNNYSRKKSKRIYAVYKSLLSGRYSARQIEPKPTVLFLSTVVKARKTTENKFIAL